METRSREKNSQADPSQSFTYNKEVRNTFECLEAKGTENKFPSHWQIGNRSNTATISAAATTAVAAAVAATTTLDSRMTSPFDFDYQDWDDPVEFANILSNSCLEATGTENKFPSHGQIGNGSNTAPSHGQIGNRSNTAATTAAAAIGITYPFDFDDHDKDDPVEVANLLSNELMQLSIGDRNAIQEEIHGVNCLAPEETPLLLESSLRQLASQLDQLPDDIGRAYRQSQKFPHTYVNTMAFRIRFLRCELFDIKRSAVRMANFLNNVLEYYGEYALKRPIRLSDLTREELKYMRRGRIQWLPFRDRSGRRIMIIFPWKESRNVSAKIRAKAIIYMGWTMGNGVNQQLKGIVVIAWPDKSLEMEKPTKFKPKVQQVATGRICAFHVCTPDTTHFRFWRAMAIMRAAHLRTKMRVHVGDTMELMYTLQGYGIPTDVLPITYTGTVKIKEMRQWMRLRNYLEEPLYQDTEEIRSVIECPDRNDIVFRQGTSIMTHPGNVTFRAMIASKFVEMERRFSDENKCDAKDSQKPNDIIFKLGIRFLVREVMEEMARSQMRVLNWNDTQGYWSILDDVSQIYMKVEYLVREQRNAIKALTNRKHIDSSTSMFRGQQSSSRCGGRGNSSLNGGSERKNSSSECFGFFDST